MNNRSLWVKTGVAGIAGIACYFLAILISWPENQFGTSAGLLVISAFPVLGIIFSYGLHSALSGEHDSAANQLGFVFAVVAFAMLLSMVMAQLAVGAAIGDITEGLDDAAAKALRRGLRLIDLGLDVGWDFLMGIGMIFWGVAMRSRKGFGLGWGIPMAGLGVAVIVLNAVTFPSPPGSSGLFDIGPVIALFWVALGVRLIIFGRRTAA